jgi:TonB family protein
VEITCIGSTVIVRLDDVVVHKDDGVPNPLGHIALAVLRGAADFRGIELREIPPPDPSMREPGIFRPKDAGVTMPTPRHEVKPQYTSAARQKAIQGTVLVSAVVLPDGSVGRVRVLRSLEFGLDAAAVTAAKQWRFLPATKDGQPVAIEVTIELTFVLK